MCAQHLHQLEAISSVTGAQWRLIATGSNICITIVVVVDTYRVGPSGGRQRHYEIPHALVALTSGVRIRAPKKELKVEVEMKG